MNAQRVFFLLLTLALVAGCDGKTIPFGRVPILPTPSPVASAAPSAMPTGTTVAGACQAGATVSTVGATGGTVAVPAGSGTLTETIAGNAFITNATVSLGYDSASQLSAPLATGRRATHTVRRLPAFTAGAGNTYIAAFCTSFSTAPTTAVAISATGVVPTTITAGTQLNIALYNGTTYVDVGTALVGAGGAFTSSAPSVTLPGVVQTGSYLVYVPAAGTNTAQINLGFALIADDGSGSVSNGFQFVQLEDPSGNAIPTPTTTFFPVTSPAYDLDGESLTPDAAHGASVDGGNTVYFFSGIPQHQFALANQTVDVTNFGGDGDAIASLPSGDQVVVSANGSQLAVLSGILSGTPVISDTITNPSATYDRDGLVISVDGTVMLSRGYSGLDVYTVTPVAAHAGSTGIGTTNFSFALTGTFTPTTTPAISAPYGEDGRDEMAISPRDSTRAIVVGNNGTAPEVQLLTGLGGTTPTLQSVVRPQFAAVARRIGVAYRRPEPSPHRAPLAVTPTVGQYLYAVAITPDGTTAYVSSDAGILTFSGVNSGALTQSGAAYSPSLAGTTGSCPLVSAPSIGVTPDGKYLIAVVSCYTALQNGTTAATQGTGVIVTIPIGAGGALGAPVGQLNNVVTPNNDQIIFH